MKTVWFDALLLVVTALVVVVLRFTVVETYEVYQTSMEPNFYEGQRLAVNKAAYWGWVGEPQRGDVIIFKSPNGRDENFIKRVIGLPGDTIKVVSGAIYVNDVKLEESYVKRSFTYSFPAQEVPEGNYFVLGDNRDVSNDSHRGWLLPRENIIGKAFLIYWPPPDWGAGPAYHLGE